MAKRLISTSIGIIVLILVMVSRNLIVFNVALTIIALIAMHEFYSAFKNKGVKPVMLVGYVLTLGLLFINEKVNGEVLKTILMIK